MTSNLEPPQPVLEDPGAHDLDSSDAEEHFSDASEGRSESRNSSTIPSTRVEKVDGSPSHGEVPGTAAYDMRTQDAVPDEVEVTGEVSTEADQRALGDVPIRSNIKAVPLTRVEKIEPEVPSHGEEPGTEAHELRKADADPDIVVKVDDADSNGEAQTRPRSGTTPGDLPIPTTKVSKVDSSPSHGDIPGTEAFAKRTEDAKPDIVEQVETPGTETLSSSARSSEPLTVSGVPTSANLRSADPKLTYRRSSDLKGDTQFDFDKGTHQECNESEKEAGLGDDFDEFEEGSEADDFGDFDDGFQNDGRDVETARDYDPTFTSPSPPAIASSNPPLILQESYFPPLAFSDLTTPESIVTATRARLDELFPSIPDAEASPLPPLPQDDTIFLTERSLSLWMQLVAPPPLQPPNWIRSRIRRLFLVSLGVPVDLDEILPASKQQKLVLPSMSQAHSNGSSTSLSHSKKRKGPPQPPNFDLQAARMLASTTAAAIDGMGESELRAYIGKLEELERVALGAVVYWENRRESASQEKTAFEGVIENLVRHARKVRK
ncbi:MAG: hypothetical protein M1825_005048 [Sarcosagium campestre]|nr:MAG: hypothetical protein M1825_005048 [Sarcosagium campestre]